jgi:hypothetical protein
LDYDPARLHGGAMKRALAFLVGFCLVSSAFAGFKVKLVKPKKPEQFQSFLTVGEVTYAADLVIDGKVQKDYFYKELTPSHVIAVRLAVFNRGGTKVVLPLERLQLTDASGNEIALVAPEAVAKALLQGSVVTAKIEDEKPVQISPGQRDPRLDPTDPRYDPRGDPNDPRYDPRYDPTDPTNPRNGRYPDGRYDPWYRPGIDVVLNPGGGKGAGDLSQFEKALVEKDFADKAHSLDPIDAASTRDKFLYFSIPERPADVKGFMLKLPQAKSPGKDIIIKF